MFCYSHTTLQLRSKRTQRSNTGPTAPHRIGRQRRAEPARLTKESNGKREPHIAGRTVAHLLYKQLGFNRFPPAGRGTTELLKGLAQGRLDEGAEKTGIRVSGRVCTGACPSSYQLVLHSARQTLHESRTFELDFN